MITIFHSDETGTVIQGSVKGDGVYEILRAQRWRWRPVPGIFIQGSRYKPPQTGRIQAAARALREAGYEVETEIDAERMTFADAEAARSAAAEDRAERLGARAERVGAQAAADYNRASQMADAIPFGQPMMPDHYSYNRDRRYRDRIHNTYGRAFAGMSEARELERRAASVTDRAAESPGTTQRRIAKLEAEERGIDREIAGGVRGRRPYQYVEKPASARRAERLNERKAAIGEEIAYWRAQLVERRAVVFGPADFTKGDYARGTHGWYEVLRVNPKSLTVPDPIVLIGPRVEVYSRELAEQVARDRGFGRALTQTMPYDTVTAKRTAAEQAAAGEGKS